MSARQPGPLNDKCLAVLRELRDAGERVTPNVIAYGLGFRPGIARRGNHGRGNVARTMGVAVHVNTTLTALRARGMVNFGRRPDGRSGTAYYLTALGERVADSPAASEALERVRSEAVRRRQGR